jgi:hypothetical protein
VQGGQVAEGGEELGFHQFVGESLQYGVERIECAYSSTGSMYTEP